MYIQHQVQLLTHNKGVINTVEWVDEQVATAIALGV